MSAARELLQATLSFLGARFLRLLRRRVDARLDAAERDLRARLPAGEPPPESQPQTCQCQNGARTSDPSCAECFGERR